MRRYAHARLVVVEAEVLLDDLLAGSDGDLDGALDHRRDPLVDRLLDGELDQLQDLGMLLQSINKSINQQGYIFRPIRRTW